MNDNNDEIAPQPMIVEPEQAIGTLPDIEALEPVSETEQDGLSKLVQSVYPYIIGLVSSSFKQAPGSIFEVFKSLGFDVDGIINYLTTEKSMTMEFELKDEMGYPQEVIDYQNYLNEHSPILAMLFYTFLFIVNMLVKTYGTVTLTKSKLLQDLNKDIPIQIPPPDVLFTALLKNTNYKDAAIDFLSRLGLDDNAQQLYWDAIKKIPDIDILFQNLWRGKIEGKKLNEYLARMGYGADEQTIITNITKRIPPIQDIIRFAVREAFSEELSARYQHDVEFPPEVADWSEKQGFSKEWALKYWRAHWQLPSVQMVFEMLHRKVTKPNGEPFNKDDMYDLLRMADYPVFWRDLLTQISYRVITRVDARRMYKLGVWDNLPDMTPEQKVKEIYESQGYNAVDAEYMKDFTVEFTADQRRNLTVSGLKKLRRYGIITEMQFIEKCKEIRIHDDEIELYLDEVNYEIEDKKFDSFMAYAKSMYLNDRWTKPELQIQMATVGISVSEPENLFEAWDYDKKAKRRVLTKADVLRLLGKGIIPHFKEAIKLLADMGYDEKSAQWYVDEVIYDLGSNIGALYKMGYITSTADAINHLISMGMLEDDAKTTVKDNWSLWIKMAAL